MLSAIINKWSISIKHWVVINLVRLKINWLMENSYYTVPEIPIPLVHLIVENLPGCNCIVYFWELLCELRARRSHREMHSMLKGARWKLYTQRGERDLQTQYFCVYMNEQWGGYALLYLPDCMWAEGCKWVTDRFDYIRERGRRKRERLTHICQLQASALDGRTDVCLRHTWGVVCRAQRI
jgi:hypothetical protein